MRYMSVPQEIRDVQRPKGTVVGDIGRSGLYPVREKLSGGYYVDDEGKAHRPSRNGRTVGHIDPSTMTFVPTDRRETVARGSVDLKDWGNVEMLDRLNRELLSMLRRHYAGKDAERIYVMAILRASYPGIKDGQLGRQYEESFLTEMYPGVGLGKNSVSTFLRNLGRCCSRITGFMREMVDCVDGSDCHIIDGSLRQDGSKVNSLSEVSRKTAKRGFKDVLLMYSYSLERKRPVCSDVYPGNMADQRAVSDFVRKFGITNGIIVADKGFTYASVRAAVADNEGLHFLLPTRRNDSAISELGLLDFHGDGSGRLAGEAGIQFKTASRAEEDGIMWYYSFRDPAIAMEEELTYMRNHPDDVFDPEDLAESRPSFGTLTFRSDVEMEPAKVYKVYDSRWLIELFFRSQEDVMGMDDTREHSDYSVIASNFVYYIAAYMQSVLLEHLDGLGLLDRRTYGDNMRLLKRIKMTRVSEDAEWRVRRIAETDAEVLEKMGLLYRPTVPKEIKKRGRPKGSKDRKPRKRRSKKDGTEARITVSMG